MFRLCDQPWLRTFAEKLPENDRAAAPRALRETVRHRKERILHRDGHLYPQIAWFIFENVTSKLWFETFILVNILLIGISTGLELENHGRAAWVTTVNSVVSITTLIVFTLECILKIVAEGYEPMKYFMDPANGFFNCFDFAIVVASYAFIGNSNGGAIGALRMLRLVRLLTFVKNVPQLRVIIAGLIQGMKSVLYIVMLLFLVIYLFAILGCIVFGENDPVHFGDTRIAMLSLFQVSTLSSWTSMAYISWYGCENYLGSGYSDENPSKIENGPFDFEGFRCTSNIRSPMTTFTFFSVYIVLTSWVIMSLFIGVISMGMFDAYLTMKEEERKEKYRRRLEENERLEGIEDDKILSDSDVQQHGSIDGTQNNGASSSVHKKKSLKDLIDLAFDDSLFEDILPSSKIGLFFHRLISIAKNLRDSSAFSNMITFTILAVGVTTGVETDRNLRCVRMINRLAGREDDDENLAKLATCVDPSSGEMSTPEVYVVISIVAQIIFTVEIVIKLLAEGYTPLKFFTDDENGAWNWLDFTVVIVGFIELSPIAFIFENFPVVVLRLLRLLRVFRLAKALPRLRSIVEALISGFSAVGWVVILIVVFNYIVACKIENQSSIPHH